MMDAIARGVTIGLLILILAIGIAESSSEKDCRREHNVFRCERIYVPVEPEEAA